MDLLVHQHRLQAFHEIAVVVGRMELNKAILFMAIHGLRLAPDELGGHLPGLVGLAGAGSAGQDDLEVGLQQFNFILVHLITFE
jgi:hypothetical protein